MKISTIQQVAKALKQGEANNTQILLVADALSNEFPQIIKNEYFTPFLDDAGYVKNNTRRK